MAFAAKERKVELEDEPLLVQEMTRLVPAAAVVAVPVEEEARDSFDGKRGARLSWGSNGSDRRSGGRELTPQEREAEAIRQAQIRGRIYAKSEIEALKAAERHAEITDRRIEEQIRRGNRTATTEVPRALVEPLGSLEPPSAPPLEEPKRPGYSIPEYRSIYDSEGGYKGEEYRSIYD